MSSEMNTMEAKSESETLELHRPLPSIMAGRFTRPSSNAIDASAQSTPTLGLSTPKALSDSLSSNSIKKPELRPDAAEIKSMKQDDRRLLINKVLWIPSRLLCKRFGIDTPFEGMDLSSIADGSKPKVKEILNQETMESLLKEVRKSKPLQQQQTKQREQSTPMHIQRDSLQSITPFEIEKEDSSMLFSNEKASIDINMPFSWETEKYHDTESSESLEFEKLVFIKKTERLTNLVDESKRLTKKTAQDNELLQEKDLVSLKKRKPNTESKLSFSYENE